MAMKKWHVFAGPRHSYVGSVRATRAALSEVWPGAQFYGGNNVAIVRRPTKKSMALAARWDKELARFSQVKR